MVFFHAMGFSEDVRTPAMAAKNIDGAQRRDAIVKNVLDVRAIFHPIRGDGHETKSP